MHPSRSSVTSLAVMISHASLVLDVSKLLRCSPIPRRRRWLRMPAKKKATTKKTATKKTTAKKKK